MKYQFDRAKPFYPLIVSYLVQLHALQEMSLNGIPGLERSIRFHPDENNIEYIDAVRKLSGPLQLAVTGDDKSLDVSMQKTAEEVFKNHAHVFKYHVLAASHCLVMGYEITKSAAALVTSPTWEFLRHCRNAIAHSGVFNLAPKEPKSHAAWRGIQITRKLDGRSLMKLGSEDGVLNIGDPIALLWDIEQENPELTFP